MKRKLGLLTLTLAASTLIGCNSDNPLIGTWINAQPNPPVLNQNVQTACNSKVIFTSTSVEEFAGERSGGPQAIHYRIDGDIVWAGGQINDGAFKFAGKDNMSTNSTYGLCFYKRAS